jgi:hypothetical protein
MGLVLSFTLMTERSANVPIMSVIFDARSVTLASPGIVDFSHKTGINEYEARFYLREQQK